MITRGNPSKIDMLLVLVQPPPDQVEPGSDWRTWVETPARVIWANLIPNEPELFLRIAYYQSTVEGCARPGSQGLEVDGNDIVATVTLMQPPPTSWAIPCDEEVVELDAVEPIRESLEPGQTYRVIVNDQVTTTFTLPVVELGHTAIAESPIGLAEIEIAGERAAPVPASRRVAHAEGRELLPVQRLRDQAAGVEQHRRGNHAPRGDRPTGGVHPRFARGGDGSAPWLRLRAGCRVHRRACNSELRPRGRFRPVSHRSRAPGSGWVGLFRVLPLCSRERRRLNSIVPFDYRILSPAGLSHPGWRKRSGDD